VHPQITPQKTLGVSPPKSPPVDLQVTLRIAGAFDLEIRDGNALGFTFGFAARTAPKVATKLAWRTTS
jgi:hypothetical protein